MAIFLPQKFPLSLLAFCIFCGGVAAVKNTKELKQTVQSGLKAQAVSLSGTLIFVQNFENDSAAFADFVKR